MNKPIVILAGRLWSAAKLTQPDNGSKAYVEFTVKMQPRVWQGKTYFQKVYCRSFNPLAVEQLPQLTADTLVTVTGEGDAVVEQGRDGKSYANIRVTGNVTLLEASDTQTGTTPPPAPPAPTTQRQARPERPPAQTLSEEDENVPF